MKNSHFTTPAVCLIVIGIFCGLTAQGWATEEPNDLPVAMCSMISGALNGNGDCPSWDIVINRASHDTYTDLYFKVEVDSCYYSQYDVYKVPQTATPEPIDLEPDDVFVVWDEDEGHGSTIDFSFSGQYLTITDPNTQCPYVHISSYPSNNIINWTLYKVETNGTLTINATDKNEHDAIHFRHMNFIKYDDVVDANECPSPEESLEYTICFESLDEDAVYEDAYIIDYLDDGVDYVNAGYTAVYDGNSIQILPPDPGYYDEGRFYVWQLGDIVGTDANCVTLDVEINYYAEPDSILHNVAELWATVYDPNGENPTDTLIATATEDTWVCCWGDPNIIYVDLSATGTNVGTSWKNAYTDLADALRRATDSNCSQAFTIYIAQGSYNPENTPDETFKLPDNCSVYGGFPAGGCPLEDRNPKKYKTILTGLIDDDTIPDADTIVIMGDGCLLDGFTVKNSLDNAVLGEDVDFEVVNCVIQGSYESGLSSVNGNVTIGWCQISNNRYHGIYHEGENYTLTVENSWILRNGEYGINCDKSTPTIKNSIVSESDLIERGRQGIRLYRPSSTPRLYNLTISNNKAEGVYFEDNGDPNWPDVRNCIIYYNNVQNGGTQMAGLNADQVAYNCCIADCNEVNDNHNGVPGFAYTIDPDGTPNPANYHLLSDALCVDEGDSSYSDIDDNDYDGEVREMGVRVDIGADEVNPDCGNVAHPLDLDADGLVNLNEFNPISRFWLAHDPNDPVCDPNHPDYVDDPNAPGYITPSSIAAWYPDAPAFNYLTTGDSEYEIDLADLMYFCEDYPKNWLWIACWKLEEMEAEAAMAQTESLISQPLAMSVSASTFEAENTESELEVPVDTYIQIIGFLDSIIADEADNIESIYELRTVLMEDLRAAWEAENQ